MAKFLNRLNGRDGDWRQLAKEQVICYHKLGDDNRRNWPMSQMIQAIYEDGVLKPLEKLTLGEHQQVQITVESQAEVDNPRRQDPEDPLRGIRTATGIPDLAEHFDDYRLGRRKT
jgi:predicted DNA-binding antitoxin AbrB/MazE fold protein